MRGVTDIGGLRDIRSMQSTGRRSIPRMRSSAYLDLYMLRTEKERLDKEAALLEKRQQGIRKRLRDIEAQMKGLERSAQAGGPGVPQAAARNGPAKKSWKTFALNY